MAAQGALMRCYTRQGEPLALTQKLGSGGEGDVYAVRGRPEWAAKVYAPRNRTAEREQKLVYMVENPPRDPFDGPEHLAFAWPIELLYDEGRRFLGFVMPRLKLERSALLFQVYHPLEARKRGLSWKFRLAVAHNLAVVLEELHAKGYVVGDLNESNFLVQHDGLVTLVDCDSIQVRAGRRVFHCRVQKPEYTPPELQGKSYSALTLCPEHDAFALAVLIFFLLMQGRHPFAGKGVQTPEEGIRGGKSILRGLEPVVGTPSPAILSPSLRRLFVRAFGPGPRARPRAAQWKKALEAEYQRLRQCERVKGHWHGPHLAQCPWCDPASVPAATPLRPSLREVLGGANRALLSSGLIAVATAVFLGLFRQALEHGLGLSQPLTLDALLNHSALWVFRSASSGDLSVATVLFYSAALSLGALGGLALGEARRLRGVWWGLLALLVLPYFALPGVLERLETAGQPGLQFIFTLLGNVLLFLGQIALLGTALPGFGLMLATEFLSSPLHTAGWPLPWAWTAWGFGLGLALGLRSWLCSRGLRAWGNGLVLGYLGIWIAAAWWLPQS